MLSGVLSSWCYMVKLIGTIFNIEGELNCGGLSTRKIAPCFGSQTALHKLLQKYCDNSKRPQIMTRAVCDAGNIGTVKTSLTLVRTCLF